MNYTYSLRAIIHHIGSCDNGHYYALLKLSFIIYSTCKVDNKWWRFEDDVV